MTKEFREWINSLFQRRAHQLVIDCQMVSPEITYTEIAYRLNKMQLCIRNIYVYNIYILGNNNERGHKFKRNQDSWKVLEGRKGRGK